MNNRFTRKLRIRSKIKGTNEIPRISVYRSNLHIYFQAIDDIKKNTIAFGQDTNIDRFAQELLSKKIKKVVFDRSGYKYHGKIKLIADKLREKGLLK